jgi:hypothetical protein
MIKLKNDLQLKYYLSMHLNSTLIDKNAILFEIISYILSNNIEGKDKEVNYKNLKFSSKTLKYIFGEKFESEEAKNSIILLIKKLVEDKCIDVRSKTFYISEKGISKFYNLTEKYKA